MSCLSSGGPVGSEGDLRSPGVEVTRSKVVGTTRPHGKLATRTPSDVADSHHYSAYDQPRSGNLLSTSDTSVKRYLRASSSRLQQNLYLSPLPHAHCR
jgi:hypothetical protein